MLSILKFGNVGAEVGIVAVAEFQILPHVSVDPAVTLSLHLGNSRTLRSSHFFTILTIDQDYILSHINTFTVVTARVVKRYNPRVLLSMLIQTAVKLELVGVQSVPCLEDIATHWTFKDFQHIFFTIIVLMRSFLSQVNGEGPAVRGHILNRQYTLFCLFFWPHNNLVIPIVKALYYSTDNMTLLLPLYAKVVDVQLVHVQPVSGIKAKDTQRALELARNVVTAPVLLKVFRCITPHPTEGADMSPLLHVYNHVSTQRVLE